MVPLMVLELLGDFPGVPGLFMACVFSASLRYTYIIIHIKEKLIINIIAATNVFFQF